MREFVHDFFLSWLRDRIFIFEFMKLNYMFDFER